jgi:hypothetical protein
MRMRATHLVPTARRPANSPSPPPPPRLPAPRSGSAWRRCRPCSGRSAWESGQKKVSQVGGPQGLCPPVLRRHLGWAPRNIDRFYRTDAAPEEGRVGQPGVRFTAWSGPSLSPPARITSSWPLRANTRASPSQIPSSHIVKSLHRSPTHLDGRGTFPEPLYPLSS